ncbi:MAG: hypothetical protein LT106_18735 [Burkholderiaceae bacterium]|nr:hypothetical protein [Burkholderiaceae bacterium]
MTATACPNEPICDALLRASLALSASNGLHVTDRPDLPRGQRPVYMLDHSGELAAIDRAAQFVRGGCASCRARWTTN